MSLFVWGFGRRVLTQVTKLSGAEKCLDKARKGRGFDRFGGDDFFPAGINAGHGIVGVRNGNGLRTTLSAPA